MRLLFGIFFLAFLNLFSQSHNEKKVDLSSPYSTVYTHSYFLHSENYDERKSAKTIHETSKEKSVEIAVKLQKILNARGLKIDLKSIPKNPNYRNQDSTNQNYTKQRYMLFPERLPEIYLEKIGKNWYFSEETCSLILPLYDEIFPKSFNIVKRLIPSIAYEKVFDIEIWQYVGFFIFIILSIFTFWTLKGMLFFLFKKIRIFLIFFSNDIISSHFKKLSRGTSLLIVFYLNSIYIPILDFEVEINFFLVKGLQIANLILWVYLFLEVTIIFINIFILHATKIENKLYNQLLPVLSKFLKFLIIFIGFLKMLTVFGVNPTTVIAGASIGGLAIALASQDSVKNLIGTLMIFLDKPFEIGDWIEGGGVEGTVEEVGFRTTRIRAVDTSIFTIPNSTLSEIVINNKGLRQYRRYKTIIGIRYDTPPELIEAFVIGIRKIIQIHPETLTKSYNVEFVGFGDSSLDILINTYFLSLDWHIEQSSKHKLHMSILNLAFELGVGFAFPSQTVMIEEFPEKNNISIKYDTSEVRIKPILDSIEEKFTRND